jgi:transposase-like protein
MTPDKLRSYGAAIRKERLSTVHDQTQRTNNWAATSHQQVRRREHKMQRFKSPGSAQRSFSIQAALQNVFTVQRHLVPRRIFKLFSKTAFAIWWEYAAPD